MIYRNDPRRKAPALSATSVPVGTRRKGQDGTMHVVVANCYGVQRWKRVTSTATKGSSRSRKTTSNKQAPKKVDSGGTRRAPTTKAREFPVGTVRRGSDGGLWIVKRTTANYNMWVRASKSSTPIAPSWGSKKKRSVLPKAAARDSAPWRFTSTKKRSATSRRTQVPSSHAGGVDVSRVSLPKLASEVLPDVCPYQDLSKGAKAMVVRIATPLMQKLARSSLHKALSTYYGESKELIKHSLQEADKHTSSHARGEAVLAYLMAELVELSGSVAREDERGTIKAADILEAMQEDEELIRLKKYV